MQLFTRRYFKVCFELVSSISVTFLSNAPGVFTAVLYIRHSQISDTKGTTTEFMFINNLQNSKRILDVFRK